MAQAKVPNLLSLASLALGFASLAAVSVKDWGLVVRLLILATAADSWSGRRAIRRGQRSPMGLELDSLSGMLTFGVAPMVFAYSKILKPWDPWGWMLAGALAAACAFRLARDNSDRPENRFYRGLPVTVFGFSVVLVTALWPSIRVLVPALFGLVLIMIVRLPYRRLGVSRLSLGVAPLAALAALLSNQRTVLLAAFIVTAIYILLGHTRLFGNAFSDGKETP